MGRPRLIDSKTAKYFVVSAYSCALFGALMTLLAAFYRAYGFDLFNLLDVVLFLGLAFGVYKRSRICAIIMFTYHLMNRVPLWNHTHSIELTFGGVAVPFAVAYLLGILGTFAHHSIKEEVK